MKYLKTIGYFVFGVLIILILATPAILALVLSNSYWILISAIPPTLIVCYSVGWMVWHIRVIYDSHY